MVIINVRFPKKLLMYLYWAGGKRLANPSLNLDVKAEKESSFGGGYY